MLARSTGQVYGQVYRPGLQPRPAGQVCRPGLWAIFTGQVYEPSLQARSPGQVYKLGLQVGPIGRVFRPGLQARSAGQVYWPGFHGCRLHRKSSDVPLDSFFFAIILWRQHVTFPSKILIFLAVLCRLAWGTSRQMPQNSTQ
jgi:hypothetical protein